MSARLLEARPSLGTDYRSRSRARTIGLTLGFVGVALATVTLVNAIAAGVLAGRTGEETTVARLLAWSFGLTVTAFGTLKLGIAVILVGILARLWLRVDSVKESLPFLKPAGGADAVPEIGKVQTPHGRATASASAPKPLLIHRMARAMWAPMLAMGVMALLAGFVLSLVQTGTIGTDAALATSQAAWVQGLQFLGEGFLLAGISFLLGTILGSLRKGGGEVQESVGVGVKTLDMPLTAKLFVGLMALGLMVEVFQFIAYAVLATFDDPARIATYFTWLGPVREAGLGILLSGIVLALATIAKALGFQSWRLTEIVRTGR
jgi:hypothetical protein